MIVTIDKRGSISLPVAIRKELGITQGSHLELTIKPGGALVLQPVEFYRTIKLNASGLEKLKDARSSEECRLPDWFKKERDNAGVDPE
ncbi:AbrB/MazE/SpoVT family DNA-binding domain-containing protein [Desulfobacter latus]|uniref:AbrB/MazE/SpoVT family DNA-binding domain-containing protein n=1 Tax=Desulfobacter latus TaxID=2292 RepID=A0A850TF96_9BACT|nr:AbrB/MazE/SpoVT family DNA-binding domain-containing protein [Desulfobacter latus]NWH06967.1 AbrB/MazE/SpoVT family DNA-binding domain-containing protein [Desulfobacter latus]